MRHVEDREFVISRADADRLLASPLSEADVPLAALSSRAGRGLSRAGVRTWAYLAQLHESAFLAIWSVGLGALEEVRILAMLAASD